MKVWVFVLIQNSKFFLIIVWLKLACYTKNVTVPLPATVVLIDDHPLILTAFSNLIAQCDEYMIVGTAGCGRAAIELCARVKPDMALIDMLLPDMSGTELITILHKLTPKTQKIVLSGLDSKEAVHMALVAGAEYYIPKTIPPSQFMSTLKSVRSGNMGLTGCVADALHWAVKARRVQKKISSSDLEVLRLFGRELPVKEIAARIGKSESTVYKIIMKSRTRLSTASDGDLRRFAQKIGLTPS